jgi:hypothetical protein
VELFYVYLCGAPRVYPLERNPVAPLGSTDSLRELLDLVARHPGHNPDHNPEHKNRDGTKAVAFCGRGE